MSAFKCDIMFPTSPCRMEIQSVKEKKRYEFFSSQLVELQPGDYLVRFEVGRTVKKMRLVAIPDHKVHLELSLTGHCSPVPVDSDSDEEQTIAQIFERWAIETDDHDTSQSRVAIYHRSYAKGVEAAENWGLYKADQLTKQISMLARGQQHRESYHLKSLSSIGQYCKGQIYSIPHGQNYILQQTRKGGCVLGVPSVKGWSTEIFCFVGAKTDFRRCLIILRRMTNSFGIRGFNDYLLCELLISQLSRGQYEAVISTTRHYCPEPTNNPVACLAFLYAWIILAKPRTLEVSSMVEAFPAELCDLADVKIVVQALKSSDGSPHTQLEINSPPLFHEGWVWLAQNNRSSHGAFDEIPFAKDVLPAREAAAWFCIDLDEQNLCRNRLEILLPFLFPMAVKITQAGKKNPSSNQDDDLVDHFAAHESFLQNTIPHWAPPTDHEQVANAISDMTLVDMDVVLLELRKFYNTDVKFLRGRAHFLKTKCGKLGWVASGSRKEAHASAFVYSGASGITINGLHPDEYFRALPRPFINPHLNIMPLLESAGIAVKVFGGGLPAQANAAMGAIATALSAHNPSYRKLLKSLGLLKVDPRAKERKKAGQPGARKKHQFSKR